MKTPTVKLQFNRRNKLVDGNGAITIEIYQSGNDGFRKIVSTGIAVKPDQWSNGKVTKHPDSLHLNKILADRVNEIENFIYEFVAQKKQISLDAINAHLNSENVNYTSFTNFFLKQIDPAMMKIAGRREHVYTYNLLYEFNPSISFADITYSLIDNFDRFMRDKKLSVNTMHKHHKHIKRYLRAAYLKGLFDDRKNPYHAFRAKKEKSDRMSLSFDEVKQIENAKINPANTELILVRDLFLFSCYTGLRFSDIDRLEKQHVLNTPEGLVIVKKMEKVSKPVTLPLALLFNGEPLKYINKYLELYPNSKRVFPVCTNQHANRMLKVIAGMTDITMRLTFHVARHTFGTMLAELTQNPYLIMDLMGHGAIDTSMIYIHSSQERINKQLRGVKWG